MRYINIEVSYRTADPEVLEALPTVKDVAVERLAEHRDPTQADEFFVLATCNRMELFAVCGEDDEAADARMATLFAIAAGSEHETVCSASVTRRDEEATAHLFRVAAGLESMAVGEDQIVGQVRAAFREADAAGTTGPALRHLFDRAVRAAKRVRRETSIGRYGTSLLRHGLDHAGHALGGLRGRRALVIGVGATGLLAARTLLDEGVAEVLLTSRTRESADRLAEAIPGTRALGPDERTPALGTVDLVVAASSARTPVLDAATLASARTSSSPRRLFLLDLARPRDVEEACADLDGVELVNVSGLGAQLAHAPGRRDLDEATRILDQELIDLRGATRAATTGELIRAMRSSVNFHADAELSRLDRRIPALSERDRAEACRALHRMAGKFLHGPIVKARSMATEDRGLYIDALTELFCANASGGASHDDQ